MNRNETYILNPDYSFKVDQDRIVMYSKKTVQDYSSSDWISFVHPVQACILNKFIEHKPFPNIVIILQQNMELQLDKLMIWFYNI